MLDMIFAFGPPGGIDAGAAVKWVIIWTVVLGSMLYFSYAFLPTWVELEDDNQKHH